MRIVRATLAITFAAASLVSPPRCFAQPYIRTVAGGGPDGLPALQAGLYTPGGLAVGPAGEFYVVDSDLHRVFRVDADGTLRVAAGRGARGYSGDGGPAERASLAVPNDVAVDATGALFISDTYNHRVRRVDPSSGIIATIAGTGLPGLGGDGGPAATATLYFPTGLVVDPAGDLLIADRNNCRVRRIARSTGIITTIAGTGSCTSAGDGGAATAASLSLPQGLALDGAGNLFIAEWERGRVRRVEAATGIITTAAGGGTGGDGGPATGARLYLPYGLALDGAGNLYISETMEIEGSGFSRIRKVDAVTGIISTFAGTGWPGFSGDGGPATAAELNAPTGLAFHQGDLHISDSWNHRVRRVSAATGVIQTVVGTGDPYGGGDGYAATSAAFWGPAGVAVGPAGDLFISSYSRIWRVDATTGAIHSIAGTDVAGFGGDGGPAAGARLDAPWGLGLDSAGNLFVADSNNARVRRIDAVTGIITTVAGTGTYGFGGDGGPATQALLAGPRGIAFDAGGNLLIADSVNDRIRRVSAGTGIITTFAGGGNGGDGAPATAVALALPEQIARDAAGNYFIVETGAHKIRKISAATGIVTTVAGNGLRGYSGDGGPATTARLDNPRGVAVDPAGNIFIADWWNSRLRRVDAVAGTIATVAGNGVPVSTGDGGLASAASIARPFQLAFAASGDLLVPETDGRRVRMISAAPPACGAASGAGPGGKMLDLAHESDGTIRLSWGRSCSPNDSDFEVYEGPIGDFAAHVPRLCSTGGSRSIALPAPAGDRYFLVVPRNAVREGHYGARSDGAPRSPSLAACLPQETSSHCP